MMGIDDLDSLEDCVLEETVQCGGEDFEISYADLVRTYNNVIRHDF